MPLTNDEVKTLGYDIGTMTKAQVEYIVRCCQRRYTQLAEEKTLEQLEKIGQGDRIEIVMCKPKYLQGMRGVVVEVNPGTKRPFLVEIDARHDTRRYSHTQHMTGSQIRKVG